MPWGARIAQFLTGPRALFRIAAIVACILATAMVVVAVTPISDPDVWWVAAAGREMLAQGAVPSANVFSFVEPGHPWLMHEWLFGPPYALGLERLGPSFFNATALLVMAIELALLALGTVGRARRASVGLVMLLAAVVFFGGRFLSARPTGVALVFPIALTLVAFGPRFTWWSAALATLIELVWANAHGSFPIGVVIVLVAAVDGANGKEDRPCRLAAAAAMCLATLATPYGIGLHRFVWGYFRGTEGVYRLINLHIKEFGSFAGAWGYTVGPVDLLALLLFVALALGAARQARYRARALFCLALFALAAMHARHLELAGLVSCLLLLPYADDLVALDPVVPTDLSDFPSSRLPVQSSLEKEERQSRLSGEERNRKGGRREAERFLGGSGRRRVLAFVLVPAYTLGAGTFAVSHHRRAETEWVGAGAGFLRALSSVPDGARTFVPFPTAGLAIWYGFPRRVRVFFDSRNDCYSADAFTAFWALETVDTPPDARRAALRDAGADAALVPSMHPMARFLASEPGWTLTHEDGDWRVFRLTP